VADFLTEEWIQDLDEALRSDERVRTAEAGSSLVIQQTVTGVGGDAAVSWHMRIASTDADVTAGAAPSPDVTFTQDHATAVAIGTGELSAQAAFMLGKLRIGGDVSRLIAQRELFEDLDDTFAEVRAATRY
jgi:putative sterol carrier protein